MVTTTNIIDFLERRICYDRNTVIVLWPEFGILKMSYHLI
jgi:hypothetical protein